MKYYKLIFTLLFYFLLVNTTTGKDSKERPIVYPGIISFSENYNNHLQQKDTADIIRQINYLLTIVRSDPDSAKYLLQDALQKSYYLKFDLGIATALADIGYLNTIEGNYDLSIKYYRKAQPYAIKGLRNRTSLAMFYTCMSCPYYELSMYDSMYFYSNKAEQIVSGIICKSEGEVIDVSSIYNNIGLLWSSIGNQNKANTYLYKAKKVITAFKESDKLKAALANINSNLGVVYGEMNQYDSSRYYFETAVKVVADNPSTLIGLSKVYTHESKMAEAISLLKEAIFLTTKANDYVNSIYANAALGLIYYDQKRYTEAEQLLIDVVNRTKSQGNIDLDNKYQAYKALADIKSKQGNYVQAYKFEQKSLQYLDSLKVREKIVALYDMETQVSDAKKDKQIAKNQLLLNTAQNRIREKNFWILAIAVGLALLVLFFTYYYRYSKSRQRLQLKELDELQQSQEINHLRSMITGEERERARLAREIHDGIMVQFSTIKMNMKSVPEQYKESDSQTYINSPYYGQLINQMEDATRELRSTAHNLLPDMLLAGGLNDALLYFCNNLQKNTGLSVSFQAHGVFDQLNKEVELSVYRIIQELLQNIIKHAHATKALVQLSLIVDNILTITVEDDGNGFDILSENTSAGIGLASIRSRLKIMNGHMNIQSRPDKGTSVHIELEILSSLINQPK